MAELSFPLEAECKYRVVDEGRLRAALERENAVSVGTEQHCDTYLRHPSRNFRDTDEALRIREIDSKAWVTYKGPRLEGPLKIRPEIELPLESGTVDDWLRIWKFLGFQTAAQVRKRREVFELRTKLPSITVTIDQVADVGIFAEIERIVFSEQELEMARIDIEQTSKTLGLDQIERRSYLGMLLEKSEGSEPR